jgi:hypothetical protein
MKSTVVEIERASRHPQAAILRGSNGLRIILSGAFDISME